MLDKLVEFARTIPNPPPLGYGEVRIKWFVQLNEDGKLIEYAPLPDKKGTLMRVPENVRSGTVIRPRVFCDTAEYVLGVAKKPELTEQRHAAFVEMADEVSKFERDKPVVTAALKFLRDINPAKIPQKMKSGDMVCICVDGEPLINRPKIREFWAKHTIDNEDGEVMQCLVCGNRRKVARRLPQKIKLAKIGGQGAGSALISANESAYEAYGLENSLTSPVCYECARLFTFALNYLMSDDNPQHHFFFNGMAFLFWTPTGYGIPETRLLGEPDSGEVKNLFTSVFKSDEYDDLDMETINGVMLEKAYGLMISANDSRVAIHDWIETTIENISRNLARWFKIVTLPWGNCPDGEAIPLWRLAKSAVNPKETLNPKYAAKISRVLMRTAFFGRPLPEWLLVKALNRCAIERRVTHARAALINLCTGGKYSMCDNDDEKPRSVGYLCGKFLHLCEKVQYRAIGNVGNSVFERYAEQFSMSPARMFPKIAHRVHTCHIKKLFRGTKKDRGYAVFMTKEIGELQQQITEQGGLPQFVPLADRADFWMGYGIEKANTIAAAQAIKKAKELEKIKKAAEEAEAEAAAKAKKQNKSNKQAGKESKS